MEKCKVITNRIDKSIGIVHYEPCNNDVKYQISYKEGARGKMVKKNVCGVHKRSYQMNCNRVNKQIGYNYSKFSFKPVERGVILNSKTSTDSNNETQTSNAAK